VGVIIMGVVVGVEQLKAFPQRRGLTVKIKPIPTSLWESRRPIPTSLWLSVRPLPTAASVLFTLRASEAPAFTLRASEAPAFTLRASVVPAFASAAAAIAAAVVTAASSVSAINGRSPRQRSCSRARSSSRHPRRAPVGRSGALW
jgi:hypothetical protein